MLRSCRLGLLVFLSTSVLSAPAFASSTTTLLSPFTGDAASVSVTLDDMADPGNIVVTLQVIEAPNTGDLRGFFLDISNDSLVSGLSIVGTDVTQTVFAVDGVINLGGGNNLNGGGTPCPCDMGVEIGDPGIGMGDDFQTTMFTLSHSSASLDLSLFAGENVGARVTSVGLPGGSRNGSSKLGGVVPEPSTAVLVALGLTALAFARRSPRSAAY